MTENYTAEHKAEIDEAIGKLTAVIPTPTKGKGADR